MLKKTIIIIESDPDILEIMNIILVNDYEVISFTTPPDDVVSAFRKNKPDMVIMDWLIPNVRTEDLVDPIKLACDDQVKIIIISSHSSVYAAFKDKNIDAILDKPFGTKEVKTLIDRMLNPEIE